MCKRRIYKCYRTIDVNWSVLKERIVLLLFVRTKATVFHSLVFAQTLWYGDIARRTPYDKVGFAEVLQGVCEADSRISSTDVHEIASVAGSIYGAVIQDGPIAICGGIVLCRIRHLGGIPLYCQRLSHTGQIMRKTS
jgi:hypothetical protein